MVHASNLRDWDTGSRITTSSRLAWLQSLRSASKARLCFKPKHRKKEKIYLFWRPKTGRMRDPCERRETGSLPYFLMLLREMWMVLVTVWTLSNCWPPLVWAFPVKPRASTPLPPLDLSHSLKCLYTTLCVSYFNNLMMLGEINTQLKIYCSAPICSN